MVHSIHFSNVCRPSNIPYTLYNASVLCGGIFQIYNEKVRVKMTGMYKNSFPPTTLTADSARHRKRWSSLDVEIC
jgi:hypothetical protein